MAKVRLTGIVSCMAIVVMAYVLASCTAQTRNVPTATPPPPPTDVVAASDTTATTAEGEATDTPAVEAESPTPEPTPTFAPMSVDAIDATSGRILYGEVCAPCHGLRARGIDGIGVDLTRSVLVAGLTSEQLADMLIRGIGINSPFNQSDIKMPPRGGRDELTDQEMLNIAAYLQNINVSEPDPESERVVEYVSWVESGGLEEIEATPEVGLGGLTGAALEGQTTYLRFCAVCHGPNAEGVESLGRGFRGSEFINDVTDEELAEFIKRGRNADDPLNETGIEMLPYGGQSYLTDDELNHLVAYVRVVSQGEPVTPIPSDTESATYEESSSIEHDEMEAAAFNIIENTTPRCFACHLISERGNQNGPGPHLNGLSERAATRVEGLSAEEYVLESILDPGAFLVEQCPRGPCVDVMVKNYDEKLTEEELDILVSFLLSLPPDEEFQIADEGEADTDADTVAAEDDGGVHVRAVPLLEAWVDQGAEDGEFTFVADDGEEYTADFENNILPLFVTPGIWYAESEACINCHFELSEDSDHEMDMGTYEGIMTGADSVTSPPGVPILEPGDWENSLLRHRLRDTRMPPDPGWEWDETEENRDGPTLTIDGGDVRAVHLLGAWVDQGAEDGEFTFEGMDGEEYTAVFEDDVLPLFTEPGAWYADSLPCTDCHFELSEDSDHEMDMSSYEGIMTGADSVTSPPGVPIVVPGDWEGSILRDRLRNTRMPPSPGWEWDRTEENRDGPTLSVVPMESTNRVGATSTTTTTTTTAAQGILAEDVGEDVPVVRAVPLLEAWVDQGAEDGEFTFEGMDGAEHSADFENNILPLFVTPGIWYADSEACINCHFELSEDSDHEMDMGTYEGIMTGADAVTSPPGVPILEPGDWENSLLRHRLRDTRMPPDPGWEWDETEENRDGPTLTIDGGDVRAVHLLGAWVDQGAEDGEFTFEGMDGEEYTAMFEDDVLPLFTEPGAWYADSLPCTDCHFEQSEDSDHEMDMSTYDGIMAGADVLSDPPGVPIVVPGDWEGSVLRDRLRNTRMPPSPGWEWDRTEENRDGPALAVVPMESTTRIIGSIEPDSGELMTTETMTVTEEMTATEVVGEDVPSIRAVHLLEAWVDQGAEEGEFTFEAIDGETYVANFDDHVLPLFTEPGAWYANSLPCTDCHFENSEDSDHEMDLGTYDGIMAGGDVLSEPPGVPIVEPGDWENSMLRHRLRDTRMPPDPGWEWDRTEENRDGPTLTIDGGDVRAVHLLGAWVDQGAEDGEFTFEGMDGEEYTAMFEDDVLPLFTEPGAWYADSLPCTDCHFEQSEDSDHEMDMSTYDGIMAGADVLSDPPGVPIVVPGDWEGSVLRDRLRNTRMPPDPGWEWDRTEENRDGPTVHIPQP